MARRLQHRALLALLPIEPTIRDLQQGPADVDAVSIPRLLQVLESFCVSVRRSLAAPFGPVDVDREVVPLASQHGPEASAGYGW